MTYTELNLFIPNFFHRTNERITKLYKVRLIHRLLNCVQHSNIPKLHYSNTPYALHSAIRNPKSAIELLPSVSQPYQSKSEEKKENDQDKKNQTVDNRR